MSSAIRSVNVIIDCHGHFTRAPRGLQQFRDRQLARLTDPALPLMERPSVTDDEIRLAVEQNHLKAKRDRGIDLVLLSPQAGLMSHHSGTPATSLEWSRICNDMIARVVSLFPTHYVGVCQLPQSPGVPLSNCVAELERCVHELGFVGCNINPDPSDGYWKDPPLTDRHWYPLFEKMVELDVPGMIHVSCSCNPAFHATGAHYINGDTTAFMQLLTGDLFRDFPTLKFVVPHGGGAVPYHWGRYRGLAQDMGRPLLTEYLLKNVFFDTCVYHQAGIDLLLKVIPQNNILFASEMVGAVHGVDPETSRPFDDTRRLIELAGLDPHQLEAIFYSNTLRVYPRLMPVLERIRKPQARSTLQQEDLVK